jgi:hypothetical protein
MRVLDSLQLTTKHQVSTPVNWKPGENVILSGSVSNDETKKKYPAGWKAPKPYLRIVPSRSSLRGQMKIPARGCSARGRQRRIPRAATSRLQKE